MRNKGFFWFLTALLTIVCIYQLSFTYVSNAEEKKAEKEATIKVDELMANLKQSGDSLAALPNGTTININNFSEAEVRELAFSAFVNEILKGKADKEVYGLFGSTFQETKKRSLALGLDLVGGMSVTMEISIPDLIKGYAYDQDRIDFKKVWDAANKKYQKEGGDFISLFIAEHKKQNPKKNLVKLFAYGDIEELGMRSTDEEVEAFLRKREADAIDGVEQIMERRINQFGVAQPNIQKDPTNNRLYIELPGVQDEESVSRQLVATANLEFYETWKLEDAAMGPAMQQALEASGQPYVEVEELDSITEPDSIPLPDAPDSNDTAADDFEEFTDFEDPTSLQKTGLVGKLNILGGSMIGVVAPEDKGEVMKLLNREDIRVLFPEDLKFMYSSDLETFGESKKITGYVLYAVKIPADGKPRVGGSDIASAARDYDQEQGKIAVSLTMTQEGGDKWAQMTEENVGNQVAITMDNVVYSAPVVNNAIREGRTSITGNFTVEEADALAGLLNGGALPAPLVIKEQTRVGPTIGKENSEAGLISFAVALMIVFVYMVFYYGKAGIVADIALFMNILFIFGSLASFGAVLTLAGIAGIVLTIGMAVDANVLIFERVREEQAGGKDLKSAIDTGFKKALSSIIDANVTTMLTAIVLKSFGSGPIESFATTLIIGIFTSVFAALVITRLCINWWMNKGKPINFESKVTKNALKGFKIDFVGKRKMYYMISGVLVVGGIIAMVTKGLNPSVEFSGGRTFGVKFEQSVASKTELVKNQLRKTFIEKDGKAASVEAKTKSNSFFLEISTNFMRSDADTSNLVTSKLQEGLDEIKGDIGEYQIMETRTVSPTVSDELIESSLIAIALSLLIIFAYILIRFGRWQYSTGAIIAMAHDVVLVLSVFSIFQGILPFNMDIDQAFVAAILTVIGYSINDTVVVFDRIRENLSVFKGSDERENINGSLNSTLSRTINTSMTTFIVLLIIFIFGGAAIKGFIFALMIGVLVGTYSSLCIATPILIDFSKRIRKTASAE